MSSYLLESGKPKPEEHQLKQFSSFLSKAEKARPILVFFCSRVDPGWGKSHIPQWPAKDVIKMQIWFFQHVTHAYLGFLLIYKP